MSKHIPRSARWSRFGPNEHRASFGRVYFKAGSWHAAVAYQVSLPDDQPVLGSQSWDLGGFKRPRNAMMAVEAKVRELQGKHGEAVAFLDAAQGGTAFRVVGSSQ